MKTFEFKEFKRESDFFVLKTPTHYQSTYFMVKMRWDNIMSVIYESCYPNDPMVILGQLVGVGADSFQWGILHKYL